ncbi:MAG: glutamate-1-semialdehyde 2,1-aminomutase [Planctomycetota bacterium]|nr:glutamate-1-semialdehyde 2,1-aminomutase [Planctomycetota bacterium]
MSKSQDAFERAKKVLVGGVNSPVRAFAAVGGTPPVIASAKGATITDVDGRTYIDYVGSYGPAILGHAAAPVVEAVREAVGRGMTFGAPTEAETALAEAIVAAMPSIQKVRFVSSGTEAVMSAVRLARGFTGRDKVIKCIGCYHGHADAMLVSAGSGALTLGVPSSPGVPAGATKDTLLVPYNDATAVEAMMAKFPGQVAAMLVEPVAANMGLVPPAEGFLQALRTVCDKHGALLIFDEVITGFRLSYGGAQQVYGVRPDLTVLGKIIGGGMPVGAYGGRAEIMNALAPEGKVYQAGTLSGNPVAMAAGLATLKELRSPGFYEALNAKTEGLAAGIGGRCRAAGLGPDKVNIVGVGSMITCYFTHGPILRYDDVARCDTKAFKAFFHALLAGGVYIAPSQFEAMFVSGAHTSEQIEATIAGSVKAFEAAAAVMK